VAFCGSTLPVQLLSPEEQISAKEYAKRRAAGKKDHVLLDVREKVQYDICNIEGSINIPFSTLQGSKDISLPESVPDDAPIYVICRLGNDSQVITKKLKEIGLDKNGKRTILDIKDGLKAWREDVDNSWPEY